MKAPKSADMNEKSVYESGLLGYVSNSTSITAPSVRSGRRVPRGTGQ